MFHKLFQRSSIARDLLSYLMKEKMWWLIPIIVLLLILGMLIIFAQSSPAAPFIYTLF